MKNKEIKKQLNNGILAIDTPDVLENIKNADFNNYKGLPSNEVVNTKQQNDKPIKTKRKFKLISAIAGGMAAIMVLAIGLPIWLGQKDTGTAGLEYRLMPIENAYEVSIGTATDEEIIIPSKHKGLPVKQISKGGFKNSKIKSVEIPDSVTVIDGEIGNGAFYQCMELVNVTLSDKVTTIGSCAFYDCWNLETIEIPDSVVSIGESAFDACTKLKSITIPKSVTSISTRAFALCKSVEDVTVSSENPIYKSDGNCIIEKDSNTLIQGFNISIIPNYVVAIGDGAFYRCTGLIEIVIPNSVRSIGSYAFFGSQLISISIPSSVISIGDNAFGHIYGSTIDSSITVSNTVKYIGGFAFAGLLDQQLTVYSETENANTWDIEWNYSFHDFGGYGGPTGLPFVFIPVIWGCTLSQDKTYVVSFTKSENSLFNPSLYNIGNPYRYGYLFGGWATTKNGPKVYEAADINNTPDGTTLYAIWINN